MKCDACGAPVENGKCTYCGKVFQENVTSQEFKEPPVEPSTTERKKTNKKLTTCKACGAEIAKGAKTCPKCGAKVKKPIYKKWWFWVLIFLIIGATGSGGSQDEESPNVPESSVSSSVEAGDNQGHEVIPEDNQSASANETKQSEEPSVPTEYKNALRKAKTYDKMMHMSKAALFEQLTSEYGEQFPEDAAQYAMDNINADYNANALAKAKTYSDTMSMSKKGIYEQLSSEQGEKFTAEEAQYAIDNLNADYNANALAKAKTYQETMGMSKSAIYDQLVSEYGEKFTADQAQYAVDNLS